MIDFCIINISRLFQFKFFTFIFLNNFRLWRWEKQWGNWWRGDRRFFVLFFPKCSDFGCLYLYLRKLPLHMHSFPIFTNSWSIFKFTVPVRGWLVSSCSFCSTLTSFPLPALDHSFFFWLCHDTLTMFLPHFSLSVTTLSASNFPIFKASLYRWLSCKLISNFISFDPCMTWK